MATFTEAELIDRATQIRKKYGHRTTAALESFEESAAGRNTFDVFLSHSSAESENILLGIKDFLEDQGLSVYVDKYDDPSLSPDAVTRKTAEILRGRMKKSSSLLYVYSRHSTRSRWMPWELGYFDGLKGVVGVLPVTQVKEDRFKGEEYLGLYPYVDIAKTTGGLLKVWINDQDGSYAQLDEWIRGKDTLRRR